MTDQTSNVGPLSGIKVIEFAGLAPVPFAGLILSDFGASVTRIDRPPNQFHDSPTPDLLCRNKRSIAVDLKSPKGVDVVRRLIRDADVLIDPFRPGILEKMGLGPEVIAGYRRDGPHKDMAGHDLNYLALSGVLSLLPGTPEKPTFPLNILGDFAGGGLTCALGILLALFERTRSGRGQVVDTDMVSGTRYLSTFPFIHAHLRTPLFANPASPRQSNVLDGGAPFYSVYTCADGQHVALGALEPRFFQVFLTRFLHALPEAWLAAARWIPDVGVQARKEDWAKLRSFLEHGFRLLTRDEWTSVFHGADACLTPVPRPQSRSLRPASRRTPHSASIGRLELLRAGQHTTEILRECGLARTEIERLVREGVVNVEEEDPGSGVRSGASAGARAFRAKL
ncbi:hypothetical protein EW146_g9441 [Bondarzewia mesenterica]|uniref:Alpha-methylacyl-CoA racemase n=1 Tax=Bondarzewia mesenterica TaxID=1095465 RepID=A0A4S4L6I6_9AGAM|nr:hypothetical protein EW146_g9441 [Bondarzewia mesenterica]